MSKSRVPHVPAVLFIHKCGDMQTSKEGNSEVYVVCLEYRGRDFAEPWLEVLRKHYDPNIQDKAMFPQESIPQNFLNQLYECTAMFKNFQTEVIETNIQVYKRERTV
jgi:cap2 methyltransferase